MAVWVRTTGTHIPGKAMKAGYEADGKPLYIARAVMYGIMIPGKCAPHLHGAHIPFGTKERVVKDYEVLVVPVSNKQFYEWKKASYGVVPINACQIDDRYIGRAFYSGSLIPGKIDACTAYGHKCAYVSYGGEAIKQNEYEVLCRVN